MPTETRPANRDRQQEMIGQTLTVTITDVAHATLLRWLANSVYHTTDEGTASDLLAEALEAKKRRMAEPL